MTRTLFIPMDPMPSPRPRFRVIGKFASTYMPADYKKWKAEAAAFLQEWGVKTGDAPVGVSITFRVTKPKTSKLRYPRPDLDNYEKSVLDAATEAGVWDDDTHVIVLSSAKVWSQPELDKPTGIYLELTEL